MENDKVYRVVVENEKHHKVATTLRKFHEAVNRTAYAPLPEYFVTRASAEEVLAAIEEQIEMLGYNLITRVEYGNRVRVF